MLARTEAAITEVTSERDPPVCHLDWVRKERLDEWRSVLEETVVLPPALRAVVLLDAWNVLHAPWLGRLLSVSALRQAGATTAAHLTAVNLGLKSTPVDRRRHSNGETRLLAIANGLIAAAEIALKVHDRLALARHHTRTLSIIAATPGENSRASPGESCPSVIENWQMSSDP
ncbi:DUF1612 domain-containing protein [Rhizobium leguminosarum]|uniref:DUF1612 domain-containing protein n=1 Tax=Rhizobium leguminosarum TaxID=384 RepID=UPI003D7C28D5